MSTNTKTKRSRPWRARRPSARRCAAAAALLVGLLTTQAAGTVDAGDDQTTIDGPAGSSCFGDNVVTLPNGNFLVLDPCYKGNTGAIHLYDGATLQLVSTLTGSVAGDRIGSGGVTILKNGNFVVSSPLWDNGAAADAGATTWGSATTGVSGQISAGNSLVGTTAGDGGGYGAVVALSNGNYVVTHPLWDGSGSVVDAGAATWGDGTRGVVGVISAANSLIGSHAGDEVGDTPGVTALTNGNYLVHSYYWHNGAVLGAGAVTWADGTRGVRGTISPANSLVGADERDFVPGNVTPLPNGNAVLANWGWNNGAVQRAGAVTLLNGATGMVGTVSAANSLVGTHTDDDVGGSITVLTDGNVVVASATWSNGAAQFAGAVTWMSGTTGRTGPVTASNSLVGSQTRDFVGASVKALANGNYVVASPRWHRGAVADAGAVTWVSGATPLVGSVSVGNSLVGTTTGDQVGAQVMPLTNGNYVVASPSWDDTFTADVGAVTWANGATGLTGPVTAAGSLTGSHAGDGVGGVVPLTNGNYVVASGSWDNAGAVDAGAITWADGTTGLAGQVSTTNSLVGTTTRDYVGAGVDALSNGNYVAVDSWWHRDASTEVGAVTWADGTKRTVGAVSAANSLVGVRARDFADTDLRTLPNGGWTLGLRAWDNGATIDAGAVIVSAGASAVAGEVGPATALVGSAANEGLFLTAGLGGGDTATIDRSFTDGTHQGAVTVMRAGQPVTGAVSAANSVLGVGGGTLGMMAWAEPVHHRVLVADPDANRIVVLTPAPPDTPPPTTTPPPATGKFAPLVPARLLETRAGQAVGTVDGQFQGAGLVAAGGVVELPVAGRGGVGADADAVVLNVAVTGSQAGGFVTVYPCGQPRPTASNLNFAAGETISNAVTAKVGAGGKVCLYTLAATHLIVDVDGWYPPGSGFVAMNPARVLETRSGQPVGTVDGQANGEGRRPAGSVTQLQIAGRAGIPADATAAVLNVAVTNPASAGFVTVFPCGTDRPTASSLNFAAGETIANTVVAKLGTGGTVCVYTFAATDVVIDVDGYHTTSSAYSPLRPARLLETRDDQPVGTVDGKFQGIGLRAAGSVTTVQIAGRGGVPANATSVVLNVAVTGAEADGFVTVYPCNAARPTASNLNYRAGQTIADNVTAALDPQGQLCIYTHGATHVVADVNGAAS